MPKSCAARQCCNRYSSRRKQLTFHRAREYRTQASRTDLEASACRAGTPRRPEGMLPPHPGTGRGAASPAAGTRGAPGGARAGARLERRRAPAGVCCVPGPCSPRPRDLGGAVKERIPQGREGNGKGPCRSAGPHIPASALRFPFSRPELLKEWVLNIGRGNFKPKQHTVICSEHFRPECFSAFGNRKNLKHNAVPTVFAFQDPTQVGARCILVCSHPACSTPQQLGAVVDLR
ncbi:hypothetical protein P7K49_015347 [Saguinus oedipus]|uniref:THAP-type domain-containing protein n=1 Tax=Saguinus oedipus TaxID=9490 RepID=A0ABQ9VB21_SAGOE|nr:hypothetical protein P7K49_015347 [Saguinus oedipus]